jgi:adenylylsulfate kinase
MPASALLVTGTVGVGKSVTANMLGSLLQARLVPHAVIDLDEIRRRWPAPPDDPFDFELELRNLQPMATNYLAAGARRLVMAGVCESRKDRDRLAAAVGVPLVVCRLRVPLAVMQSRLRQRHAADPAGLAWHMARAGQLDSILDAADIADVELSTDDRTVPEIAAEVAAAIGWSTSVESK